MTRSITASVYKFRGCGYGDVLFILIIVRPESVSRPTARALIRNTSLPQTSACCLCFIHVYLLFIQYEYNSLVSQCCSLVSLLQVLCLNQLFSDIFLEIYFSIRLISIHVELVNNVSKFMVKSSVIFENECSYNNE